MKTSIENIINELTYMVIDNEANRFNFVGLVRVTAELAEDAANGNEYKLSDELPEDVERAVATMIDNGIVIDYFTSITSYDDGDDTIYLLAW